MQWTFSTKINIQFQIRTKTIILLAFLITEEEDHLISADDANFMLLVKILQSCLEKKDRFSRKYGFRANEVLEVFNLLGAIDSNKVSPKSLDLCVTLASGSYLVPPGPRATFNPKKLSERDEHQMTIP